MIVLAREGPPRAGRLCPFKQFLANASKPITQGKGNQLLQPRIENGVKVFNLVTSNVRWEVDPGRTVDAMAYNGQVPGPQIRVRQGDRVRVVVRNSMEESTAVHFHGVITPNSTDGVPYITQPPIKPGQTFTYEFVAGNAGSHMYHSHHNAAMQVGATLVRRQSGGQECVWSGVCPRRGLRGPALASRSRL
ncbi:hypothetical protein BH23GEM5_BH23GEM5_14250 [soil metagenome]